MKRFIVDPEHLAIRTDQLNALRDAIKDGEVTSKEDGEKFLVSFSGQRAFKISFEITDKAWQLLNGISLEK